MLNSDMTQQSAFDVIFRTTMPGTPRERLLSAAKIYFPCAPCEVPYFVARGDEPAWRVVMRTARRHLERQLAKDGASEEVDVNISFL